MLNVILSDGIKKEILSLPKGHGGKIIEDLKERREQAAKTETISIFYILAKSVVP